MGCKRVMTTLARLLNAAPQVMARRGGLIVSLALHFGVLALLVLLQPSLREGRAGPSQRGALAVQLVASERALSQGQAEAEVDAEVQAPAGADQAASVADAATMLAHGGEASTRTREQAGLSAPAGAPSMTGSSDYGRRMLEHIRPFRRYPETGGAFPVGRAKVGMLIDNAGNIVEVWLQSSSGHHILDREAVDTVVRADPMPAPPAGWEKDTTIVLPIDFSRRDAGDGH